MSSGNRMHFKARDIFEAVRLSHEMTLTGMVSDVTVTAKQIVVQRVRSALMVRSMASNMMKELDMVEHSPRQKTSSSGVHAAVTKSNIRVLRAVSGKK